MKYFDLFKTEKLLFGVEDLSRLFGISLDAAKVSAVRYVKKGILLRIKRNMYILNEKWKILEVEQKLMIANFIQTPSYISLMTALDYFGITTQIQQNFFESIVLKRTKQVLVEDTVFNFTRISNELYFGFIKEKDFFIADPEKAFLDVIYLTSIGRYSFDLASIDFSKLNSEKIIKSLSKYPQSVKKLLSTYEYI